jgi:hypothetical protein
MKITEFKELANNLTKEELIAVACLGIQLADGIIDRIEDGYQHFPKGGNSHILSKKIIEAINILQENKK